MVIPAVPLGQRAEAVFYLLNDGFDNLEVSYRLPADSSRVPFTIELPEGNLIGIARERLPVLVSFTSKKPLGFTARLDFLDSEGKSYGVNISGLSDNSLLSVSDFVDANQGALQFENQGKTGPLILEEATYALPASNLDAVGPLELSPGLYNFLAATTSIQLDQANLVPAMASTRGKQLIELVETLSGKPFGGKTGKLNANKKEAIEQIHGMFDKLLSHMKSHGALLNAVKPHYLLSKADFKIFLMVKETAAAMGGHEVGRCLDELAGLAAVCCISHGSLGSLTLAPIAMACLRVPRVDPDLLPSGCCPGRLREGAG